VTILQALFLGIVQGLTEFLPVSSSGHLVIFEHLLNVRLENINFDVFVHTGTLLAVLIYYRRQLIDLTLYFLRKSPSESSGRGEANNKVPASWFWYIIIGTIPAGIIGLLFEDYVTQAFNNVKLVGIVLVFCGIILISTRWVLRGQRRFGILSSFLVGIAQSLAITPGLSRSGMTISTGLFLKIEPTRAADFSFLLSIPAVAGATILKLKEVVSSPPTTAQITTYLVGGITSFIVGYISIIIVLNIVKKGKFSYFGIYCIAIGLLSLLFLS